MKALPLPVGLVEFVSPFYVKGWAFNRLEPQRTLDLVLRVDGLSVGWFRPNTPIPAIAKHLQWSDEEATALIGFETNLPEWVADGKTHHIELIEASTGTLIRCDIPKVCYIPVHQVIIEPEFTNALCKPFSKPLVSIIVLNRNGCELLKQLFESWSRFHVETDISTEWIIVDHASTDGSLELLKQWQSYFSMQVIALDYNDSFSASCNRAASLANGKYLLFLNNDIVWLHNALPALVETLAHNTHIGIVGMKLLKAHGNAPYAQQGSTSVQHLGVRYTQAYDAYWPYEITPSLANRESEFSPQKTPAVTAAAMLCRREEFESIGRFNEAFFYGFEDVEFCLRLGKRLDKVIMCRNDLVALHRHGYTRLTGRESTQFQRIIDNAKVLNSQCGIWIKYFWWNSLLSADRILCTEPLTIGMVIYSNSVANLRWAKNVAEHIGKEYVHARVVFVHSEVDIFDVRGIHLLIVNTPYYSIEKLHNARSDLVILAWVSGKLDAWLSCSWWLSFNGYIAPSVSRFEELKLYIHKSVCRSSKKYPLGHHLIPNQWSLRIGLDWNYEKNEYLEEVEELSLFLKKEGFSCFNLPRKIRVIDIRIYCYDDILSPSYKLNDGVVNVLWKIGTPFPIAEHLYDLWNKQIEDTFLAS